MKLQSRKLALRFLTPLACLTAMAACSSDPDDGSTDGMGGDSADGNDPMAEPGPSDVGGTVEIFSWWTSGGEQEALQAALDAHKERVPNAKVVNAAENVATDAREKLAERMQEGLPPDTFQANIGADLFKWVLFNGTDDSASKVESLQKIGDANGWFDKFDPDILDAASFNGKLYAVPVNVHRINSMFYRKDLFEKHGLTPPTSLEELHTLCDEIKADADIQAEGPEGTVACMGLGNLNDWTLSLMVFEMVLPAVAGGEYYESFWRGNEKVTDQQIADTLDEALFLYCGGTDTSDCPATGYFNADIDTVDWTTAVGKMVAGSALMAPMGDWAKAHLESEGLVAEEDFGVIPFPGTDGTFVFTSDSFPLTKGAPNREGAIELLRTLASKEAQIAFNRKKGSISARTDIDPTEFDEQTQGVIAEFKDSTKVMALSGLKPGDVMPTLNTELRDSMEAGSTEIISNYLEANYSTLGE